MQEKASESIIGCCIAPWVPMETLNYLPICSKSKLKGRDCQTGFEKGRLDYTLTTRDAFLKIMMQIGSL